MEIKEKINKSWQRECLESIFGDEEIHKLRFAELKADGVEIEFELECILKRVPKKI